MISLTRGSLAGDCKRGNDTTDRNKAATSRSGADEFVLCYYYNDADFRGRRIDQNRGGQMDLQCAGAYV